MQKTCRGHCAIIQTPRQYRKTPIYYFDFQFIKKPLQVEAQKIIIE